MIVVLYRWRLDAAKEEQFIAAWSDVTRWLLGQNSRGSRLHRCEDGTFYGYAQWPSRQARERAFAQGAPSEAMAMMADAVVERFPEQILTPIADFLI